MDSPEVVVLAVVVLADRVAVQPVTQDQVVELLATEIQVVDCQVPDVLAVAELEAVLATRQCHVTVVRRVDVDWA